MKIERRHSGRVTTTQETSRLARLNEAIDAMLEALATLVAAESPSDDVDALRGCAEVVTALGQATLGVDPQLIERGGSPHLLWTFGEPRVLLLGHFDTVWATGTT